MDDRTISLKMMLDTIDANNGILYDSPTLVASLKRMVMELPSAQPERDIPKKPNETTDRAWGIPKRQAVCPNCDSYLGMVHFISENGKTKVTYCESCGQAIDWEGWDFDE